MLDIWFLVTFVVVLSIPCLIAALNVSITRHRKKDLFAYRAPRLTEAGLRKEKEAAVVEAMRLLGIGEQPADRLQ